MQRRGWSFQLCAAGEAHSGRSDGVAFGDLVFQNLDSLVGQSVTVSEGFFSPFVLGSDIALLDGFSVRDVLIEANLLLSGEKSFASQFDPADLDYILFLADTAFNEGLLNLGAQYLAFPPSAGDGDAPVPEPSTWAMLLIGFAGLSFAGWRASRRGRTVVGLDAASVRRGPEGRAGGDWPRELVNMLCRSKRRNWLSPRKKHE